MRITGLLILTIWFSSCRFFSEKRAKEEQVELWKERVNSPVHIQQPAFEGYIYPRAFKAAALYPGRFTPGEADIILVEKVLSRQLKILNESSFTATWHPAKVHEELPGYVRQYVGYIDDRGEKIIWINCTYEPDIRQRPRYGDGIIKMRDGGSAYWNARVNLSTGKLFNLYINDDV
ncbi:hypothetical protein [Chitinophaga sp. XS-30]|uniref:hypothetical protein n=1 Tax=Chitinophaga sp. XS-30 TaxID=2604421 RepID=UPI0011DE084E|nr:hypothetical protein [Chitinophaga sp. XS-30]QEH40888.1 hypothetical protein FW415_08375 [Chitinophaga sp. XS-30]